MNIAHSRAGGQPMETAAGQSSARHESPGRASSQRRMMKPHWSTAASALIAGALVCATATPALADEQEIKFDMVRSAAVVKAGCLPNAKAKVKIESEGAVEHMRVKVEGLPPNTDFDFFVIQVPNPPFGLSWYQGDIETDGSGKGSQRFIGRFNIETFIVAPNVAPAPIVFNNAFPDVGQNPATFPVHQYHLGLWFNDPRDAAKAGCPGTVTPFNGEHNAGIQVLNTSNFPDLQGPLFNLKP
ncbi:hypothetical protein [Paraburkholderia hospita]|nr:hypothetical protein [Paraburkholderia hospita]SEI28552.1 hypothetical protein SAMN05192544_11395 [Paraburkholderia hospita]